jgi:hypothetical protein
VFAHNLTAHKCCCCADSHAPYPRKPQPLLVRAHSPTSPHIHVKSRKISLFLPRFNNAVRWGLLKSATELLEHTVDKRESSALVLCWNLLHDHSKTTQITKSALNEAMFSTLLRNTLGALPLTRVLHLLPWLLFRPTTMAQPMHVSSKRRPRPHVASRHCTRTHGS